MLVGGERRTGLGPIEEVGVTGDLAELHDDIHEASFTLLLAGETVDGVDILFEDAAIPFALEVGEADVDVDLLL